MDQWLSNRQLAKTHQNCIMAEAVNFYVVYKKYDMQLHKAEWLD